MNKTVTIQILPNDNYWETALISKVPVRFYKEANETGLPVELPNKQIVIPEGFLTHGIVTSGFDSSTGKYHVKYGYKYGNSNDRSRVVLFDFLNYKRCSFVVNEIFFEEMVIKGGYKYLGDYKFEGDFIIKDHQLWIP